MPNTTNPNYINMVTAIATYLGDLEVLVESDPETTQDEKVDLDHLNGQYIRDRLDAESDALDMIASQVRARLRSLRAAEPTYTITITESQRKIVECALKNSTIIDHETASLRFDFSTLPTDSNGGLAPISFVE